MVLLIYHNKLLAFLQLPRLSESLAQLFLAQGSLVVIFAVRVLLAKEHSHCSLLLEFVFAFVEFVGVFKGHRHIFVLVVEVLVSGLIHNFGQLRLVILLCLLLFLLNSQKVGVTKQR